MNIRQISHRKKIAMKPKGRGNSKMMRRRIELNDKDRYVS